MGFLKNIKAKILTKLFSLYLRHKLKQFNKIDIGEFNGKR
jgi:hypothetical protein